MFAQSDKRAEAATGQLERPRQAAQGSGEPSLISADMRIVGDLECAGEVHIDGKVEGNIHSATLVVNQGALVEGSIFADTARISGSVNGRVEAKSVIIGNTAKVVGDIIHQTLEIDSGAYVEGQCSRMEAKKADGEAKVAVARPGAGAAKVGAQEAGAASAASAKPAAS